jgi:hypothetical protein
MFALLSCGVFPFLHKFKDLYAGMSEDKDDDRYLGWSHGSSSFQPTHGRVCPKGPDHELVDGTRNGSEDGPQDAQKDYPASPAAT